MSDPDKPRTPPSPRDRVRARAQRLAQLAVIAAAPVLNTACDPAPAPSCASDSTANLVKEVSATALWIQEGAIFEVQITVAGDGYGIVFADQGFTVTGGTPGNIDVSSGNLVMTITPDAGATQITLTGKVTCAPLATDYHLTLDVSGTPAVGAAVPVTVN
jgi:hypothetical protein